jgi:hypothetical protein
MGYYSTCPDWTIHNGTKNKKQNQKPEKQHNKKKSDTTHTVLLNERRVRESKRKEKKEERRETRLEAKKKGSFIAYRIPHTLHYTGIYYTTSLNMNMNMMVDDNLDYPNLTTCQLKLIGSVAANDASRPPIELPKEIREDYMKYSNSNSNSNSNGNNNNNSNDYDDFSLGT